MASGTARRSKRARLAPSPAAGNDGPLPAELLSDILLRLPAKALCRLRLVCRAWRALTSDPHFAGIHASRHRQPLVAALCKRRGEIHLVDLSGDVVKRMPVAEARLRDWKSLTTQPGLLCVSEWEGTACVLDAATGAAAVLPADPAVRRRTKGRPLMSTSVLGRVPSTGEHKVLRIHLHAKSQQTCDAMTLGSGGGGRGRWRATPRPPMLVTTTFEHRAVVDGVAYFLLDLSCRRVPTSDAIASFDLRTEEWRSAMLRGPLGNQPGLVHGGHLNDPQLAELNGFLVTIHRKDRSIDLWFLESTDKELWTKRYSMRCVPNLNPYIYWSYPLSILDDGRIVTLGGRVLRAYDPETSTWADLATLQDYCCVGMFKGNLLCSVLNG
ncbi:hypothetical protein ACP70R_032796 [Stipagrostis hirtigluma subsp. patula]